MSKAVSVPGGVAIIAVAAGGALWGVLGALIAIPVAASLLILVKEVFYSPAKTIGKKPFLEIRMPPAV